MKTAKKLNDVQVGETYTIESIVKIQEANPEVRISWRQVGSIGCMVNKIQNVIHTKGLLVFVYRTQLGDCSANGISSKMDQLILIGEGVPEIFEGDDTNTVRLVKRQIFGSEYMHVEPISDRPYGGVGPMAGGNFVYTSDSRFPNKYPLSIHDRFE